MAVRELPCNFIGFGHLSKSDKVFDRSTTDRCLEIILEECGDLIRFRTLVQIRIRFYHRLLARAGVGAFGEFSKSVCIASSRV